MNIEIINKNKNLIETNKNKIIYIQSELESQFKLNKQLTL
jgi:hypothetical protein